MKKKNDLTDIAKKVEAWFIKTNFIEDQINKLELLKNFPIINISVFLLKCQLIEFRLRQLLFTLDLHVQTYNTSKLVKRNTRKPKDMDRYPLGKLVYEYTLFSGPNIAELNQYLDKLTSLRNNFTHHLFSHDKDVKQMSNDADEGIKIANIILKLMEDLDKDINKDI